MYKFNSKDSIVEEINNQINRYQNRIAYLKTLQYPKKQIDMEIMDAQSQIKAYNHCLEMIKALSVP